MTAKSISVEAHGFLSATTPGIRPVLLQNKQADQANATNGRLLTDGALGRPGGRIRRSDLTVVGADKLSLLNDVGLRRPQDIERLRWGPQNEYWPADRQ
jgi:hypothetical protein